MEQQNRRRGTLKYKTQNSKIQDMELLGDTEQQNTRHGTVGYRTWNRKTQDTAAKYETRDMKSKPVVTRDKSREGKIQD